MSLLAPLRQSIDRLTELARNASSCSPRISDEIRSLYDDLALAEREIDFRLKSQADAIVRGAALVSKLEEASAELERANAVARAADQAKTEFLASVSHEIRTPLNGVVGMLEILALEKLTAHQREFVDTAQVSAETLLHLINDLLDFAKIEAGKMTLEAIPFDLEDAVDDVASMLAVKADQKGLDLIVDYTRDTPRKFIGDPARVRQIVTNLVGNAIKFTADGHVLIQVSAADQPDDYVAVEIAVHDTGIGIAEENWSGIFEVFSQADSSTTRHFGGTGLGLAITKQLSEQMGGGVSVTSELGRGSRFCARLQLKAEPVASEGLAPTTPLHGLRAIIVDDNRTNLRVLEEHTVRWGMRVDSFESGLAGLDALRAAAAAGDPYRIGLIDHNMPEMDGEELGKQACADPALSSTILVMLTSSGYGSNANRLLRAGFSAYMLKPVRRAKLLDALTGLCRDSRPQRASSDASGAGCDPASQNHEASGSRNATVDAKASDGEPRVRVLLAEDNVVNQKVIVNMLRRLECHVEIANDGHEATERFNAALHDVVFMDCQMPKLNGFEATAAIRDLEADSRRIPIIAMTANAHPEDREKCLDAGMDDHVGKPVKIQTLADALRRWVPERFIG